MTGATSMMLGPFAFEAVGFGYTDVSRRVQTPWADIAVAQDLNQLQWTGPTSEEVSIKGVIFPREFPATLEGLVGSANAGTPMMFVSGDVDEGLIHGMFTIQSIDEDRGYHDAGGRAWRNAYTITLKRYAGGGDAGGVGGVISKLLSLF
ncbi:phage tail protein [Mesorhizobium sp. B2-5-9]|uniref:phage tail protein n=1 Tax=Mesorhizobium sp. B2-5-9 TaxID=2589921 RepID=UPI0011282F60|nr:phage tail protein [Mesorhizobium sp. B2-5-9]TPK15156.1 phage tail protein [Mesorhizobium sp. B2-5-9]